MSYRKKFFYRVTALYGLGKTMISSYPLEILCLVSSFIVGIVSDKYVWAYYALPLLLMYSAMARSLESASSRRLLLLPAIHWGYLLSAFNTGFSPVLFIVSVVAAIAVLLYRLSFLYSTPAWIFVMLCLHSAYMGAVFIVASGCLLLLSVIVGIPGLEQDSVRHILVFSAFVVSPAFFLSVYHSLAPGRSPRIPAVLRWTNLLLHETILVAAASVLLFSAIHIALMSRVPKPYTVYLCIAFVLCCDFSSMLHGSSPRRWNALFFKYRHAVYIPVLFMGLASLYIEIGIVGWTPRTIIALAYLLWLLATSVFAFIPSLRRFATFRNHMKFHYFLFVSCLVLTLLL